MTTVIDTNILIYLSQPDSDFHNPAVELFTKSKARGPIVLTDMAYAEFSVGMTDKIATDEVVKQLTLERIPMNDEALYEAGRLFKAYRAKSGKRDKPLPDHFIAAHAKTLGAAILTNNSKDYATVPDLEIISLTE